MKYIILAAYLLCGLSYLGAHTPSDLTLKFTSEGDRLLLHVNTTQHTAIDIIHHVNPSSKGQPLRLNDCSTLFTNYLNDALSLTINGEDIRFNVTALDLNLHDAVIELETLSAVNDIASLVITVKILDFYANPNYFVRLPVGEPGKVYHLVEDQDTLHVTAEGVTYAASGWDYRFLLLLPFMVVGVLFWREVTSSTTPLQKKPTHAPK
ncbi:MAG: hypothetical protein AAF597_17250 [Bacteroidota bacterium]